jgi:GNAT superfamily N-acetyltransferase
VGLPEQKARYVLPALDPDALRALAESIDEPSIFLKVCAPPGQVAPLLPARWKIAPASYFMAATSAAMANSTSIPAGYRPSFRREKWGLLAALTDEKGALAANGRLMIEQGWAIFDRIETDEAHRRRGLGTAMMHALQREALSVGVRGGLLVATADGERLYTSLGWTILSDYSSMVIPPPSPAAPFTR